jgi:hypothetical protein
MATVLVIQWEDKDVPEVWAWPGESLPTERAAAVQAAVRLEDREGVKGRWWLFTRKCGTRRMVMEG